ncbi:PREDICTED: uncharacterized protein LOC104600630 [Nelumbo nucifera]|uniref:Uncharacterized protein LOC104600630 n=2 Tax=Nelumbo nucifera TaxID=4432 RepID=A0A1U8A9X6_NELNU|nr:PREDICTED: uncharacterized protein LOC104600630 [Nelumbo nucifera]DAD35178.1 TPA_asm: hypothetical protein HUJ06_005818 [Nelumbo nucifera]
MKGRGRAAETSSGTWLPDYYSSSDAPCRKHPSSSSVGICAYCLKDRLVKLVCSDCGEQRLSSCSCSEVSSYPNSYSVEVGSVGRISFLIENEKAEFPRSYSKPSSDDKSEASVLLNRSRSINCVDVKRNGFWRFGRCFRKKREKGYWSSRRNIRGFDEKGEMWVFDYKMGVSRSETVSGLRAGFDECVDGASLSSTVSGRGVSDVSESKAVLVSESRSGVKDVKSIKDSFNGDVKKGSSLVLSEADFDGLDDSGFIDLNLGCSSESRLKFSDLNMSDGNLQSESGFSDLRGCEFLKHGISSFRGEETSSNGSSCRITVNDKGTENGKKRLKAWRWIFRH